MHEYDTALKLLLQRSSGWALREITGTAIREWINVELPAVRSLRVDMLGNSESGELVQVELQSTNDAKMPVRMLEYYAQVGRLMDRFPRQVVLYVGEDPMRMSDRLETAAVTFQYHAVDVRDLDGDQLLSSPDLGDNILAVLARWRDSSQAVRQVVGKIASLAPEQRSEALSQLLVLAGLRRMGNLVEQEAKKMPLLNDILDHEVLGREYKKGRQEGRQEGREEGAQHEALVFLRRQIEKRFGALPAWVDARLASCSLTELEELGTKLLDARSMEELLQ